MAERWGSGDVLGDTRGDGASDDDGESGSSADDTPGDRTSQTDADNEGCACRATPRGDASLGLVAILLSVAARRRSRRDNARA